MYQESINTNTKINNDLSATPNFGLNQVGDLRNDLYTDRELGAVRLSSSSTAIAASPIRKSWVIPTDFNGDGKNDVIWRDNQTGDLQIWLMDGNSNPTSLNVSGLNSQWDFQVGDFNGDGRSDLFWRNYTTGANQIWINSNNGSSFIKTNLITVDPQVEGDWYFDIGDFNGDGKHDLMWRNYDDGRNAIWRMDGSSVTASFIQRLDGSNLAYDFDIGDFNGDGKTDLFWRHGTTGENAVWLMDGFKLIQADYTSTVNDFNWDYEIGDTNNDGKSDIIWNHRQTREVALWQFNGTVADARLLYTLPDLDWEVEVGDVNGDGNSDLIWRNYQDNRVAVWEMNGFSFTNAYFLNETIGNTEEFQVIDTNGDKKADLFWRNYISGDNRLWLLNGQQVNSTSLGNVPRGWLFD